MPEECAMILVKERADGVGWSGEYKEGGLLGDLALSEGGRVMVVIETKAKAMAEAYSQLHYDCLDLVEKSEVGESVLGALVTGTTEDDLVVEIWKYMRGGSKERVQYQSSTCGSLRYVNWLPSPADANTILRSKDPVTLINVSIVAVDE